MKRLTIFFLLTTVSLAHAQVIPDETTDALLTGLDTAPFVELALEADRIAGRFVDPAPLLGRFEELVTAVAPRVAQAQTPAAKLEVLAHFLYEEQGFARHDVVPADVFVAFHEVLEQKQWNCLGLVLLYMALGERLDLPLKMVAGPGHVFIEYSSSPALYVETTQRGRVYAGKGYVEQYLPFPCVKAADYRTLEKRGALATTVSQMALAHQARDPQAARLLFEAGMKIDPTLAEPRAGLGFLYLVHRDLTVNPIPLFHEAIALDPAFREAYAGLGTALHATGELDGAIAAYRKLLGLCAGESKALYNLAQLLSEKDLHGEAADLLRRYVALIPQDIDGHLSLALALEDAGAPEAAIAAYQQALKLDPTNVDAYINSGLIFEKSGDWTQAFHAYVNAMHYAPEHPLVIAGAGRHAGHIGNHAEAIMLLTRATKRAPDNPDLWADLAAALQQANRPEEALKAYQQAITLDPAQPEALKALQAGGGTARTDPK